MIVWMNSIIDSLTHLIKRSIVSIIIKRCRFPLKGEQNMPFWIVFFVYEVSDIWLC